MVEASPSEAESSAFGGAAPDSLRAYQTLENLRLDVEAVFDKYRELWPRPAGSPLRHGRSMPAQLSSDKDHPESLFHFVGVQQGPASRTPWAAAESDSYFRTAGALPRRSGKRGQRGSVRSVGKRAHSMGRLKRERASFLTESDTNWMHGLVEEPRRPNRIEQQLSRPLFSKKQSGDFIPRLVRRTDFELARAMMMILDAVLVVWEMQDAANRATSSTSGGISDTMFFTVLLDMSCVLFVVDLWLRFTAGRFDPLNSVGRGWQTFHVVVVISQLVQAIGQHSHRHQRSHSLFRVVLAMFSTLRLVRVLSLVVVTDVIRQHRSFRELRIMVLSLTGAVKAMVWSSLLVFMILLIFGTILSEGALAFLTRNGLHASGALDESLAPLGSRFGSLFDAVLTLFQVISGGVDWEVLWQNLGALGWGFRGLLLLYIGFSLIAVLNVVTAVMFESTQLRCNADRGLAVQSELMEKRDYLNRMRKIFEELDDEGAGEISQEQMRRRMQEPEIGAYFSQMGVDSDQVGKLFHLLDFNRSGTLDSEEFMFGCLKFRGEAKRLDVAVLHRELSWIHDALEILGKQQRSSFSQSLASQQSDAVRRSFSQPARLSLAHRPTLTEPLSPGCIDMSDQEPPDLPRRSISQPARLGLAPHRTLSPGSFDMQELDCETDSTR